MFRVEVLIDNQLIIIIIYCYHLSLSAGEWPQNKSYMRKNSLLHWLLHKYVEKQNKSIEFETKRKRYRFPVFQWSG